MARYDEHGIPIIESQEEADRRKHAAQQLADADDERQFRRDQRRTNDRQFWANVIIGIGTVGSTIFAGFQARSASRAADTAQSTLHELKSGDGARDTHVLAEQAKAQAEAMRSLAQAADKQAKDTAALVNNYSSQLELARSSQALSEAHSLPDVRPNGLAINGPLKASDHIGLINTFINYGESTAYGVLIGTNFEIRSDGRPPDFPKVGTVGSKSDLAGKAAMTVKGLDFGPLTSEDVINIETGSARFFMTGVISFSDFRNTQHQTFFCMVYKPRLAMLVDCDKQHP